MAGRDCTRCFGFAALITLAVAAILMIPGCGGEKPTRAQTTARYSLELREAVSTSVPEGERRARMLGIVDQLETLNQRFDQETTDFVASYRKLNADYDATRAALEQLFSDYDAKRVKARNEALDLHFQLAALATTHEWDAIGKAELKLYEEANEAHPAKESTK